MAYDEKLAERVRRALKGTRGLAEKQLFGGIGFLIHGNMACGVHKQALMVRIDPTSHEAAIKRPHARVFDLTGRPMKGWLLVEAGGLKSDASLAKWVREAVAYANSLPPKAPA